ncbi:MAG: carbohydrate kinase [Pseudomonadota bacterium]
MSIAIVGEALIDFIAADADTYRPHLGGSPFNVAIGLARQGMDVSYLSPLSNDRFGDQLLEALQREGVKAINPRRSPWPTSLALVTVAADGAPSYRLYREGIADKDTTFEGLRDLLPDALRVFHTGSLAITPSQLPKLRQLFAVLRERGALISIDINIRLGASVDTEAYLAGVRSLFSWCDVIKASDQDLEAMQLAATPREAAAKVHEEMADGGIVVLTEGSGGSLLIDAQGQLECPAYAVAQVEDTVGAGDTFHSAFLAGLVRADAIRNGKVHLAREALADLLDTACAAAAINVTRRGCSPPTAQEVARLRAQARPTRGSTAPQKN